MEPHNDAYRACHPIPHVPEVLALEHVDAPTIFFKLD
jgi:hypothetical protein